MSLDLLLAGLHAAPEDRLGWLAIGDCLEEMGMTAENLVRDEHF